MKSIAVLLTLLLGACSWFQPAPPPAPADVQMASPAPVHHMALGTKGIRDMQQALMDKGYYHGKIDGVKGPQTHAAVARFQQDTGIQPVTGEPDEQTWSALNLSE